MSTQMCNRGWGVRVGTVDRRFNPGTMEQAVIISLISDTKKPPCDRAHMEGLFTGGKGNGRREKWGGKRRDWPRDRNSRREKEAERGREREQAEKQRERGREGEKEGGRRWEVGKAHLLKGK